MYAVIATGGKQYRVQEGDQIKIEKLPNDVNDEVVFDKILMIGKEGKTQVGDPYVKNAKVKAKILEQDRGPKIKILKFKRRKHHMKRQGHRQDYSKIQIESIKTR